MQLDDGGPSMDRKRSYDDGCAFAQALDLVGERWALLIVRELLFGPKRFTDLKESLPGIATNVLTQRLVGLGEAGRGPAGRPAPTSARPGPTRSRPGGSRSASRCASWGPGPRARRACASTARSARRPPCCRWAACSTPIEGGGPARRRGPAPARRRLRRAGGGRAALGRAGSRPRSRLRHRRGPERIAARALRRQAPEGRRWRRGFCGSRATRRRSRGWPRAFRSPEPMTTVATP